VRIFILGLVAAMLGAAYLTLFPKSTSKVSIVLKSTAGAWLGIDSINLVAGDSVSAEAVVMGLDGSDDSVMWSVTPEKGLGIYTDGKRIILLMLPNGYGKYTVKATSTADSSQFATVTIGALANSVDGKMTPFGWR
jgi:hypothetical protein